MSQRPTLLLIVVIAAVVMGLWFILQGLGYMDIGPINPGLTKPADTAQDIWDLAMNIAGAVLIIIGLISLLIAWLAYNGSRIARLILIVVIIFELISTVFNISVFSLIMAAVCIFLLYILFRPDVKQFFRA